MYNWKFKFVVPRGFHCDDLSITYLYSSMDGFSNRLLAFQWVLIVHRILADLFRYSYEADFLDGLLKQKQKQLAQSFNFRFRHIDDVLSLNNFRFGDFLHLMII